jgi:hypothetical protein
MARQTIKIKGYRRKYGGNTGKVRCNMCHGTGVVKKGKRRK